MDLSGDWRAHIADDELRRDVSDPATADDGWPTLPVPGHWRNVAAFADSDGPVFYRRRFEAPAPAAGRRSWLVLDGVFSQSDVWLDGKYLGDTEGYFFPHAFEVTEALAAQPEHLLAVEVSCPPQRDRRRKRSLTGAFQHSPYLDPGWNPGGMWAGVHVDETGPVRIERLRVLCLDASPDRAVLELRAVLDAPAARTVRLRTAVGTDSAEHEAEHSLAAGANRVAWRVTVERPALWWPKALGAAPLTDVQVSVRDGGTGELSDERVLRVGLRQVRERGFVFEINGERLHLKGVMAAPSRMALGAATPDELRADLVRAQEAGFDMVRLHAHISRPEVYDAADEMGLLLWQDFPMYRGYARSVRAQIARQGREAVDLLGHHPSIIVWCGHDEPLALGDNEEFTSARSVLRQEVPAWGKTVLDLAVHRALARADHSRPVIAHSGVLPNPLSGGTDTHLSFGWQHGAERDLPVHLGRFPRLGRFVSAFGAPSVPLTGDAPVEEFLAVPVNATAVERFVPRDPYPTDEAWRAGTQAYQADLDRRQIEELRRLKYRPNGGFALAHLADPLDHRAVSTALFDDQRVPKLAVAAVAAALRPVIITADRLPARVAPAMPLALDVHVVSDLRTVLEGAVVEARLAWPGGERTWRWQGTIGADAVTRVGMVQAVLPSPMATGELTLDLRLDHPQVQADNRYTATAG